MLIAGFFFCALYMTAAIVRKLKAVIMGGYAGHFPLWVVIPVCILSPLVALVLMVFVTSDSVNWIST